MKRVGLVYDDVFLKHENPPGHPESTDRLVSIMRKLRGSAIWDQLVQVPPRKVSIEELARVHTKKHIESLSRLVGYADPDTYVSEGSYEAALYAAGGLCEAVRLCREGRLDRAFCAVRPPGHHAEADRAMGFCLFNNVAVAARYAQSLGYGKVFIVDFDVHHGNGTQHIFEADESVFYFSSHQSPYYPGTGSHEETGLGKGQGTTANYPLSWGAGDREIFLVYNDILPQMMSKFGPEIVLVSAGYDILASDPLAGLRVSEEGLRTIVKGILSDLQVPTVFALEGGYNTAALAEAVLLTLKLLLSKDR